MPFELPHPSNIVQPLVSRFDQYERFLRTLETEGGRTLLLILLVVGFFMAANIGVPRAEEAGDLSLIALLLRLARRVNPKGLLTVVLEYFKKSSN